MGGGIALGGGSLFMLGGLVRGCSSDSSWDLAAGGGLFIDGKGGAILRDTKIDHCHAASALREAHGGGVTLYGGWLSLESSTVVSCSTHTGDGLWPWATSDLVSRGGGLALTGGGARLLGAHFLDSSSVLLRPLLPP